MIAKTSFRYADAGDLVQYISRDAGERVPMKDHTGRELNRDQLQNFVEESRHHGMERAIVVSPDPDAGFSPREVDRGVRDLMREWRSDRRSTRYVYGVHDSGATPHAHVAVTGPERQLRMDRQDVRTLHDLARKAFAEPERLARRRADRTAAAEAVQKSSDRVPTPEPTDSSRAADPDPAPEREVKREPERHR